MYKLLYLPKAREDIDSTMLYIAETLKEPRTALKLLETVEKQLIQLQDFPYSGQEYPSGSMFKFPYRMLFIKNYIVFYTVNDAAKTVEIHRFLYSRRDHSKML